MWCGICCRDLTLSWNGNFVILTKISLLATMEVVEMKQMCLHFDEIFINGCTGSCQMTTSSAASDENFVKMTTFVIQLTSLAAFASMMVFSNSLEPPSVNNTAILSTPSRSPRTAVKTSSWRTLKKRNPTKDSVIPYYKFCNVFTSAFLLTECYATDLPSFYQTISINIIPISNLKKKKNPLYRGQWCWKLICGD